MLFTQQRTTKYVFTEGIPKKKKKKILGVIRPLIQLCGFLNILVHLSDCSLVNAPFMSYLEVHS